MIITEYDELVNPIEGELHTGEPCSTSNDEYDTIKSAIEEYRKKIKNGIDYTKDFNWKDIQNKASSILRTKSKDLLVVIWFIFAVTKQEGFTGLRNGLHLLLNIVTTYWNDLYPNFEKRYSLFNYMTDILGQSLRLLKIAPQNDDAQELTLELWDKREVKSSNDKRKIVSGLLNKGRKNIEHLQETIISSIQIILDIKKFINENECYNEFESLLIDLNKMKQLTEVCLDFLDNPEKRNSTNKNHESDTNSTSNETISRDTNESIPIESCVQALEMLELSADYLIQNQPLCPTGYIAKSSLSLKNNEISQLKIT